jgi:hypothetical protein
MRVYSTNITTNCRAVGYRVRPIFMILGGVLILCAISCCGQGLPLPPTSDGYSPWPGYWEQHRAAIDTVGTDEERTGTLQEAELVLSGWSRYGFLQQFWTAVFATLPNSQILFSLESGNRNQPCYYCRAILRDSSGLTLVKSPAMILGTSAGPLTKPLTSSDARQVLSRIRRLTEHMESDISDRVYDPNVTFLVVQTDSRAKSQLLIGAPRFKLEKTTRLFAFVDSLFRF